LPNVVPATIAEHTADFGGHRLHQLRTMRKIAAIGSAGLTSVWLHPLRNVVTALCVVAGLLPYLVGAGMAQGLRQAAEDSIRHGADLYVSGRQLGRTVPIPLAARDRIQVIDGVTDVVPRIVGAITLGKDREPAILLGAAASDTTDLTAVVDGRLYRSDALHELVIGTELARRLHLRVGSQIPPFYHSSKGDRVSRVVGIFRSDVPLWQSRLVLTSFETAAAILDQEGLATDFAVYCRPGYQATVSTAILRNLRVAPGPATETVGFRVTAREDLEALLPAGISHREGLFVLHCTLGFTVAILAILVTSGFGLAERRREIGILKATGWQTDEILLRSTVESLIISVAGAAVAIVAAFVWLECFNGRWIASVFLPGTDVRPSIDLPFRLLPTPALLGLLIAVAVVLTGTLSASWRAATVPPAEAMR
jgi:ABC-type lipoprotein release transport system permease subunit